MIRAVTVGVVVSVVVVVVVVVSSELLLQAARDTAKNPNPPKRAAFFACLLSHAATILARAFFLNSVLFYCLVPNEIRFVYDHIHVHHLQVVYLIIRSRDVIAFQIY